MLTEVAADYPQIIETFEEAGAILGRDLWALVRSGPAETLAQTELTQPLMLAGGVAVWRAWCAQTEMRPAFMAGHSLGEYSALVAAGSLEFSAALRAVVERARLMQTAVPAGEGAMAAILGLDDATVEALCRQAAQDQVVAAANYNSPGQIVIAGHRDAVDRAMEACKTAGARRAMKLPMSVPSHCALMKPAALEFEQVLAATEIRAPRIPVLHNADLQTHDSQPAIRSALVAQLCAPVQWTATIQAMSERGIGVFAECGPGRVLSGLGRRIDRQSRWIALETPAGMQELLAQDEAAERTSS